MDVNEKVEYWIDISEYDLETAEAMLQTKRFLYVGFMCHQAIEKILKAHYVLIKKEVIEKLTGYTELVKKYFAVKMVILFGSYSKNLAREDSDIDVAVVVDRYPNDVLTAEVELFKLRRQIDSRIEPVLFEIGQKDPSGFFQEILDTGVIIYQG